MRKTIRNILRRSEEAPAPTLEELAEHRDRQERLTSRTHQSIPPPEPSPEPVAAKQPRVRPPPEPSPEPVPAKQPQVRRLF